MNTDDKTMLALAALTYRGFAKQSEGDIDTALRSWLPALPSEGLGKWSVVWGPAAFRTPLSLFHDAMVYVARQEDRPAGARARYAIAIRGTNPVSAFDWVFGDFFVSFQVDWLFSAAPAKLSASTALELEIIRGLGADGPATRSATFAELRDALTTALRSPGGVPELDIHRLLNDSASIPDSEILQRIHSRMESTTKGHRSRALGDLFGRMGLPSLQLQHEVDRQLFDTLLRQIHDSTDRGEKLIDFLSRAVEQDAIVAVTGHSKGGALSVATALWLAETLPSSRNLEIQSYAFAGPTPGNAAFAQRYNARLAARTRRSINRFHVVPQAFASADRGSVATNYPLLAEPTTFVVSSIRALDYTHVGGEVIQIQSQKTGKNLAGELTYQHLDAYLKDAQFQSPKWNATSIFLDA